MKRTVNELPEWHTMRGMFCGADNLLNDLTQERIAELARMMPVLDCPGQGSDDERQSQRRLAFSRTNSIWHREGPVGCRARFLLLQFARAKRCQEIRREAIEVQGSKGLPTAGQVVWYCNIVV